MQITWGRCRRLGYGTLSEPTVDPLSFGFSVPAACGGFVPELHLERRYLWLVMPSLIRPLAIWSFRNSKGKQLVIRMRCTQAMLQTAYLADWQLLKGWKQDLKWPVCDRFAPFCNTHTSKIPQSSVLILAKKWAWFQHLCLLWPVWVNLLCRCALTCEGMATKGTDVLAAEIGWQISRCSKSWKSYHPWKLALRTWKNGWLVQMNLLEKGKLPIFRGVLC